MLWLTVIVLAVLFFMYLSQNENNRRIQNENKKKEKIFFFVATIIMIFFVGLRTQYNDTTTYVYGFNNTNAGWSEIQNIDWSLGRYPGFSLLVIILRTIGVNAQMYLFLTSAFTIFIMMWFLRKYSHNLLFSTFVFITYGVFTFTMAAIKQCLAISFCLLAINFYLNKKGCYSFYLY